MRAYTVQPGDSPAKIAIAFAGCPKCSRDLVRVNRHKPIRVLPNGYETFEALDVGEQLALPDKWFDGTLDRMPESYFEQLPSADGGFGVHGLGVVDASSSALYFGGRRVDNDFGLGAPGDQLPPLLPSLPQFVALQSRPDPSSPPDVIASWLNAQYPPSGPGYISPYWAYPEWGWVTPAQAGGFGGGAAWVAYWNTPAGDSINWWINPDGSWGYHHTWGGFDLKRSLQGLANALAIVAGAFGWVGAGQFVYMLNAAAGNGSPAVLASSLGADYYNLLASKKLAQAVQDGSWKQVWDTVTQDGSKLSDLQYAFAPGPAPDSSGNLTIPPATGAIAVKPGQCPVGWKWTASGCVDLGLPPKFTGGSSPSSGSRSTASAVAGGVLVTSAVAAGGLGLYAFLTKQTFSAAAKHVWREIKGGGAR